MNGSQRGQFRSHDMDDLAKWKDSLLWDDEQSRNEYAFPLVVDADLATREGERLAVGIPDDGIYRRGSFVCATSPDSHIGPFKHAIDFLVPDGTPAYAARDGVIIEARDSSNEWGDGPEFRDLLNYMTVQHNNGEFTQYCHLAQGSCRAARSVPGRRVSCGTQIAVVGKTGWTDRDHLHFIVFRSAQNESPFGFKSLKPRFI